MRFFNSNNTQHPHNHGGNGKPTTKPIPLPQLIVEKLTRSIIKFDCDTVGANSGIDNVGILPQSSSPCSTIQFEYATLIPYTPTKQLCEVITVTNLDMQVQYGCGGFTIHSMVMKGVVWTAWERDLGASKEQSKRPRGPTMMHSGWGNNDGISHVELNDLGQSIRPLPIHRSYLPINRKIVSNKFLLASHLSYEVIIIGFVQWILPIHIFAYS
ncbi:hypothetical protein KY290_033884 [Solanum tuberosum]|uniref:Uncharacterized protein n=1 Tax=Solanum tuberosum TaxID=4113 RepID=A0ABQ7U208_SOLTU|nr:hypothetical protein KY289_033258 [Solanum tuberosum]KAH0647903.1 hypothetical protein KY285_033151 [Solanum tuberosum]KAH0740841.1 hypothetical protein KY290_033884 [Solanum tuberosum]